MEVPGTSKAARSMAIMEEALRTLITQNHDVVDLWEWMRQQSQQGQEQLSQLRSVVAGQVLPPTPMTLLREQEGLRGFHALVGFLTDDWVGQEKGCYCDWKHSLLYLFEFYEKAGHDINGKVDLVPYRRKRFGTTPLIMAIQLKKTRLAESLIEAGADVNVPDDSGFTPLHWVVLSSSAVDGVANALVSSGADVTRFSSEAKPVIHLAVDEGRLEIVQLVVVNGGDVNVTYPYEVIKEECWARVKSRYHVGEVLKETKFLTPVSRAVRMRKLSMLQWLLLQPNVRVSIDDLHFCILEGDTKVACMLIPFFEDDTLCNDVINGQPALLSLGKKAFVPANDEDLTGYTIQLVVRYVSSGWDIIAVIDALKANRNENETYWSVIRNPLMWMLTNYELYMISLRNELCDSMCQARPELRGSSMNCDLGGYAKAVAKLCAEGANVCNFQMQSILLTRSCFMVSFPDILKNLHRAGANLGDVRRIVALWNDNFGNNFHFSSRLRNFLSWYELEISNPPSLFVLCSRKVRMLLEGHNLKQVLIRDLKMPPGVVNSTCQKYYNSEM